MSVAPPIAIKKKTKSALLKNPSPANKPTRNASGNLRIWFQRTAKKKQAQRHTKLGTATPQSSAETKKYVGSRASKTPETHAATPPNQRRAPSMRKSSAMSCQNKLLARKIANVDPKMRNAGMSIQLLSAPR